MAARARGTRGGQHADDGEEATLLGRLAHGLSEDEIETICGSQPLEEAGQGRQHSEQDHEREGRRDQQP